MHKSNYRMENSMNDNTIAPESGWTRHGHRIAGAEVNEDAQPEMRARCGGPALCPQCALDAGSYRSA